MTALVGVDGCKSGWFYVRRDQANFSFGVVSDFVSLTRLLPPNSRVFIDIPIGLIDRGQGSRCCDVLARKALGQPRGSSVFPAPAFPVLTASTYAEAKALSFDAIGKKLSQQAFALIPKIREINQYLVANPRSTIAVREVHPEVCFWALNGRQAMHYPKKNEAGFQERIGLLKQRFPNVESIVLEALKTYKRSVVARDDIVDALVALLTADTCDDKLRTFPPQPETDSRGLAMEIVFAEEGCEDLL